MDNLILKDGTEIEILEGASLNSIQTVCADAESMADVVSKLTYDNVSDVQFTHDGSVTGEYHTVVQDTGNYTVREDGTILLTISLRNKTDTENRLDALEDGQRTQDGAINDLGSVLSDVVEGE